MSLGRSNIEKSLYPSTLFHFTDNYTALKNILRKRFFKVSYANETIVGLNAERNFGIPMVSFCDIRLSQLNEHTKKYGQYGLGMSKKWAIESGLNPVNYLNHNCTVFSYFNARCQQMNRALRRISMKDGKTSDLYQIELKKYRDIINVMRYMKNYEAPLVRKGVMVNDNYRFANESEWRYIPDIRTDIVPIKIILDEIDPDWKFKANLEIEKHKEAFLSFDYSHIKYIFVKNERMARNMIKFIMSTFEDSDSPQLISKIFISSQVFDDL